MAILNFTIRSQDIDNKDLANTTTAAAKKTIRLEQHLKIKYLKLLHIYHNLDNSNISDGDGTSNNTILFAKISFLNGKNSVFFEYNNGQICLGETIKDENSSVFKDLYKVLHDGKQLLYLNQPFTVELFKLVAVDPAVDNTDISVYNATNSHKIEPITIPEFRGDLAGPGQYISFTFEYQEEDTK
jgi:hypothetical protein